MDFTHFIFYKVV